MKSSCMSYGWKGNWKVSGGSSLAAGGSREEVASMPATCLCNSSTILTVIKKVFALFLNRPDARPRALLRYKKAVLKRLWKIFCLLPCPGVLQFAGCSCARPVARRPHFTPAGCRPSGEAALEGWAQLHRWFRDISWLKLNLLLMKNTRTKNLVTHFQNTSQGEHKSCR